MNTGPGQRPQWRGVTDSSVKCASVTSHGIKPFTHVLASKPYHRLTSAYSQRFCRLCYAWVPQSSCHIKISNMKYLSSLVQIFHCSLPLPRLLWLYITTTIIYNHLPSEGRNQTDISDPRVSETCACPPNFSNIRGTHLLPIWENISPLHRALFATYHDRIKPCHDM